MRTTTAASDLHTRLRAQAPLPKRTELYLLLVLAALPVDFFQPTAALLREGGAKPAIPLMVIGAAWIFYRHWAELIFGHSPKLWRNIALGSLCVGMLGTFAFLLNVAGTVSGWGGARSPLVQFVSQALLFALVAPVLIAHAWLFSFDTVRSTVFRMLPRVVTLHLLVIGAEAANFLDSNAKPLAYFRGAIILGRLPTGLMTEPSYVGAFAGMYGLALMLCTSGSRKKTRLLGLAAVVIAFLLGGKTLIPALVAGAIAYAYQQRLKVLTRKVALSAFCLLAAAAYTITSRSVLNVQQNLSSAMRLGSTLLAINVASAGYGVLGLGFGQFNFIYKPEFAPWFLQYSAEAQAIFSQTAGSRASTYNLPIRYVVEAGLPSFFVLSVLLIEAFRFSRARNDVTHRLGAVITGASLGFLMTQDTYFYPALVLGIALLVSRTARIHSPEEAHAHAS